MFYFNPRSPCGERQHVRYGHFDSGNISIHAPRVGSDSYQQSCMAFCFEFQSTLPVWGATTRAIRFTSALIFQSTLPVWGATFYRDTVPCAHVYFNPRSPCGERPGQSAKLYRQQHISIHAPRVGSDATCAPIGAGRGISIHAPRVGSDLFAKLPSADFYDFNPRSPCGERRKNDNARRLLIIFQSTLPVWGATG